MSEMNPLLKAIITPEVVEVVANRVIEKLKFEEFISKNNTPDKKEKIYSVKEVAAMVNRHKSTITYHIGLGLIKATKPGGGKKWIITEENYQNYIQNKTNE